MLITYIFTAVSILKILIHGKTFSQGVDVYTKPNSQFMVYSDPICFADIVKKNHSLLLIATLFFILHCTSHFCFEYVGYTPLHDAAQKGRTDLLNSLINAPGCDINVKVICKSGLGLLT